MGNKALVSVIVPCYNGEKFVGRFLESVLGQTYEAIEVFLVDDDSTDATKDIVLSYVDKFKERGLDLNYIYQKHSGQSAAINKALPLFKGEYLKWFDSDDIMEPQLIEKQVNFLETNLQYGFCQCQFYQVRDENTNEIIELNYRSHKENEDFLEDIVQYKNILWPDVYMARRDLVLKAIPTKKIYPSPEGQNLQMLIPLAYYSPCGYIDEPLVRVAVRKNSHSRVKRSPRELLDRWLNSIIISRETFASFKCDNADRYLLMNQIMIAHEILRLSIIVDDVDVMKQSYMLLKKHNKLKAYDRLMFFLAKNRYIIPAYKLIKKIKTLCFRWKII